VQYAIGIGMNARLKKLGDHRYFANLFRLYLHATAYNLLVHMRRAVADPPRGCVQRRVAWWWNSRLVGPT
jgi:hypothetical protein